MYRQGRIIGQNVGLPDALTEDARQTLVDSTAAYQDTTGPTVGMTVGIHCWTVGPRLIRCARIDYGYSL